MLVFWSHHRRVTHLFSGKMKVRYLLSLSAHSAYHSLNWRPFSIQGKAVNHAKAGCIMLVNCESILGSFMLIKMANTTTSGKWKNLTTHFYMTFTCIRPDRRKRFACLGKQMSVMKRNSRRGQTLSPLIKTLAITTAAAFLNIMRTLNQ